jgi:hypothetical protein
MRLKDAGKLFFGVTLGFMLGVVLYQSSRMDVGLNPLLRGTLFADTTSSDWCGPLPICGGATLACGDPQCGQSYSCCDGGNTPGTGTYECYCSSSSYQSSCGPSQTWCEESGTGYGNCCNPDEVCNPDFGTCGPSSSSSYNPPPPPSSNPPSSYTPPPPSSGGASSPC